MKVNTMMAKMKKIRDKAINGTATVLAAPAIIKSKRIIRQADRDTNTLKEAKKYKGAPDYDNSGRVTDAFKVRSMAEEVRERLSKKK